MQKPKRRTRERRPNKENDGCHNGLPNYKRTLQLDAKLQLKMLSEVTEGLADLKKRQPDFTSLCPWNQIARKSITPPILKKSKMSESITLVKQSKTVANQQKSSSRRKHSCRAVLTEGNLCEPTYLYPVPPLDQKLHTVLKFIERGSSNLFPSHPKNIERTRNYSGWKQSRQSLPNILKRADLSGKIKCIPSAEFSQLNFHRLSLKCKESTLYTKKPKQHVEDLVKCIGANAVFVKYKHKTASQHYE